MKEDRSVVKWLASDLYPNLRNRRPARYDPL